MYNVIFVWYCDQGWLGWVC